MHINAWQPWHLELLFTLVASTCSATKWRKPRGQGPCICIFAIFLAAELRRSVPSTQCNQPLLAAIAVAFVVVVVVVVVVSGAVVVVVVVVIVVASGAVVVVVVIVVDMLAAFF